MEQITCLLFIRRLDDLQTARERKATRAKAGIEDSIFPSGNDADDRSYSAPDTSRKGVAQPWMTC